MSFLCRSSFDLDLFVDGYEEYIEDAKEGFEAYKRCMQGIMAHYSLKRESEVVLGRPLSWDPLLKADKGKVMEAIEGSYEAVKRKFRAEFLRNVSTQEEQRKKACAWYAIAYDRRNSMVGKSVIILLNEAWNGRCLTSFCIRKEGLWFMLLL